MNLPPDEAPAAARQEVGEASCGWAPEVAETSPLTETSPPPLEVALEVAETSPSRDLAEPKASPRDGSLGGLAGSPGSGPASG